MINKELIELQIGCKSTAVIISNEDCKELEPTVIINANTSDKDLFSTKLGNTIFSKNLDNISQSETIAYIIINGIDEINVEMQNRYIGLVKDRELMGYNLPKNVIILFTVKDKESLKKISGELYNLCVVAF